MPLFHYCTNDTFTKVLQSREVWACEMSLANDSMEGRWFHKLATEFSEAQQLTGRDRESYRWQFDVLATLMGAAALCLSEEGDSLSQWRGYADDGRGVSIGFSEDWLAEVQKKNAERGEGGKLVRIEYDPAKQMNLIKPVCEKLIEIIKSGHHIEPMGSLLGGPPTHEAIEKYKKAKGHIMAALISFLPSIHLLKNTAFKDEKEWRFVFPLVTNVPKPYEGFNFSARKDSIVPYKPIKFASYPTQAISEIRLGPKNITPIAIVEAALDSHGFANVSVTRSTASYR